MLCDVVSAYPYLESKSMSFLISGFNGPPSRRGRIPGLVHQSSVGPMSACRFMAIAFLLRSGKSMSVFGYADL